MSFSWQVEIFDRLPSTQDVLRDRVLDGICEVGQVVVAHEQTQGRGRHGRIWNAGQGNLTFSFAMLAPVDLSTVGHIAFIIANALADAICKLIKSPERLMLKWPNDLLMEGQKCAGILIEREENMLLIGAGVNTQTAPEYQGVAISDYVDRDIDNCALLDEFLARTSHYCAFYDRDGFAPILSLWLSRAHTIGAPLSVKLGENILRGTFDGIDAQGALLLRDATHDTVRKITAGEVFLGP